MPPGPKFRRRAGRKWLILSGFLLATSLGPRIGDPALAAQAAGDLYVSPGGSDSNSGASRQLPLHSISAALERARPGTTIFLLPGTYYEQVVSRGAGRSDAPITIRSLGGPAIIDGSRLGWPAGRNQNQGLVELRHPFVELIELTVAKSPNTGILLAASDLKVVRCNVADSQQHGVSTLTDLQANYPGHAGTMIGRINLEDNVVERSSLSGHGQAVSLIADGFVVSGNTVRNNKREGIDIWLGARRGEVEGNVVHDNRAAGIYVDGASDVRIHRNRVFRNGSGIGISSEDVNYRTRDILVDDNVVHENGTSGIFLWDEGGSQGHPGVQNVVVLHNTVVGNRYAFYMAGRDNSGRFLNNLARSRRANVLNDSRNSTFVIQGNVWLPRTTGFVAPAQGDYRLTASSPAIDEGVGLATAQVGGRWSVDTDFAGARRPVGNAPDAGAFEFGGTSSTANRR